MSFVRFPWPCRATRSHESGVQGRSTLPGGLVWTDTWVTSVRTHGLHLLRDEEGLTRFTAWLMRLGVMRSKAGNVYESLIFVGARR